MKLVLPCKMLPLGLTFLLCILVAPPDLRSQVRHASGTLIEDLSRKDRTRIEKMLDQVLTEAAARLPLIEGQSGFDISTRLVPRTRTLIIDLGSRAIPAYTGSELEDQQHQLYLIAVDLLRDVVAVDGAEFRYLGRDIFEILPDSPPRERLPLQGNTTSNSATPKVALAGGHGLYFTTPTTTGAPNATRPTG